MYTLILEQVFFYLHAHWGFGRRTHADFAETSMRHLNKV